MQFGFRPRKDGTDAILTVEQTHEKYHGIGLMERSSVLLWYTRVDCQGPGSAPKPYARFECETNFSPCTPLKTRSIECREIDGLEESVHMWAWYVNGVMQCGCTRDRLAVDSKSFNVKLGLLRGSVLSPLLCLVCHGSYYSSITGGGLR